MPEQIITNHIKVPNHDLEILRTNFPHCFDKDGNFQIEKFTQNLSEKEISFSNESYGMDWLGKSYSRLLASDSASTLLKPNEAHNQKPENQYAENLLIKGDNLEVLKHLSGAYFEKIKMIYIDPPYNTGNDGFVYQDDRKFTARELQNLAGIDIEKAKRILDFTKSKSNSHSAWLTFMYPRLYIAKQLLKDDGVIFISIDDNEVAQLRLLMDEIFGEENFVGEIIIKTATDNNPTQIATEHEYILSYSKNNSKQNYWAGISTGAKKIEEKYLELKNLLGNDLTTIQKELRNWIKKNKKDLEKVSHYENVDEKGVFHDSDIANTKYGGYEYDIIHPDTGKKCKIPEKGYRFPEETMIKMIRDGNLMFGEDETTLPKPKKRLEDVKDTLRSVLYEDGRTSTKELENLFGMKSVFNNPKSLNILKRIFNFLIKDSDLILDFFAGSGTTGDAVMQLNAEYGGNRKFILVQIPETIDPKKNKVAYDFVKGLISAEESEIEPTIFEITKERLIRAAKKINLDIEAKNKNLSLKIEKLQGEVQTTETATEIENLQAVIPQNANLTTQNVFKVFETMPIWDDYDFEADQMNPLQQLFESEKLVADDLKALLTTWKTYDGISLTEELQKIDLGGYESYYSNNKLYLMNKGFTTDNLIFLLEKIDSDAQFSPASIISFGYHFDSKNLREISENIKSYSNQKNTDIDFITRY